ncbi:MAG TPA: hypothetical protein VFW83_09840, partial [Bryobacteraceae bacterium]|nr:hypothetical protein [Bryobacteraceae bacterium]
SARRDTFGYRASKFLRRNAAAVTVTAVAAALLLLGAIWAAASARRTQRLLAEAQRREEAIAPELIRAYDRLGDLSFSSDPGRAAAEYQQAAAAAGEFLGAHPERGDVHSEVRRDLAWAWTKLGDLSSRDALKFYSGALTQFEASAEANPGDRGRQKDVIAAARKLGLAQFRAGDRNAALSSFSRALKLAEGLDALDPDADTKRSVAECRFDTGQALAANGARDAAATNLRKALEIYRELAKADVKIPAEGPPADFRRALEQIESQSGAAAAGLGKQIAAELSLWR